MGGKQLTVSSAVEKTFPQHVLKRLLPDFDDSQIGKFVGSLKAAFYENPELLRCKQAELLARVRDAVEAGVTVAGVSPDAHLIPYGDRCRLNINHRGLIRKAKQCGAITRARVGIVYEEDEFEYRNENGDEYLNHMMNRQRDETRPPTHYWSMFWLPDESKLCSVMTRRQCEEWRDKYSPSKGGPWSTSFDQMSLKTVVRWPFLREEIVISDPRIRDLFAHAGDVIDGEVVEPDQQAMPDLSEQPEAVVQQFDEAGLPTDIDERTNAGT